MASRQQDEGPRRKNDRASRLVWLPCPACGRGVQLSHENRVADEDGVYECPECGARLVVCDV
jgi:predicted RNA-binding Zn-ribbon protein involved in translation (DUF1610 family)